MDFEGAHQGPISIRKLQPLPADIATLARWLSDERVLLHWDGRDNPSDEARIRDKYLPRLDSDNVPCIVSYEGTPIGFLQFYPVEEEERELYGYPPSEQVYALDQFIGEPAYWDRGIGTGMVRLILSYLFGTLGAHRVVLDPVVDNPRAIRCYEKCGFAKVKILPNREFHEGHWLDSWLMEVQPDTYRPE